MAGNEENVRHVTVDIGLHIEDGIDPKEATEYLEKLFIIGDRLGELLHNEKLTIGEAFFVIYLLEKGALSTMDISIPDDTTHMLLEDNKAKMDIIANTIIKNKIKKGEKENDRNFGNFWK